MLATMPFEPKSMSESRYFSVALDMPFASLSEGVRVFFRSPL